jgi:predicted ribosome quality control (RQC) complex YloA/Tae2 family protein
MAFDGMTVAAVVAELQEELLGGRIDKIAQPEHDELILTVKAGETKRLLLSADASLPLVYLTQNNKPSPQTAPAFCMLLRKHLNGGKIVAISQPGLERVIRLQIGHLNEMGDYCEKALIIEIMGKHSNIIFVDEEEVIIDSIKRVSGAVSSVREVLPGRPYFIATTTVKANPLEASLAEFETLVMDKAKPLHEALYTNFTGISPVMAQEICFRAGCEGNESVAGVTDIAALYEAFLACMEQVREQRFAPTIDSQDERPHDFAVLPLSIFSVSGEMQAKMFNSVSVMLEEYYQTRSLLGRIRQKSTDLRKIVQTALERNRRKYDLQLKQIADSEKKDKYRLYGELLNTYGYQCEAGAKSLEVEDYHSGKMLEIPLDPLLSAGENAQKYFDKYNKLKRTAEALATLTEEVLAEINHLESIATSLEIALQEEDLVEIKEEMIASGYIRRKGMAKKVKITSKPLHYLSSDGFHIYVGKNNLQNEELTFRFATGEDWWFHAKGIAGSHVIVKSEGKELPDRVFEEAGALAAFYSKGRETEKVEVDYVQRKHVKKPNGAKLGFVVYYTNYSLVAVPGVKGMVEVS